MDADLRMAEGLKNFRQEQLFVIFGEPDMDVLDTQGRSIRKDDSKRDIIEEPVDGQLVVKINGVDVFHPNTSEVHSDSADGIVCWFLETDYNEESFFVRRLLTRRERSVQGAEDHAQSRNRPRLLGNPQQRHFAPIPKT